MLSRVTMQETLRMAEHERRHERRAGERREEKMHALVAAGMGRGGEPRKPAAKTDHRGQQLQQPHTSMQPQQQQSSQICQFHGPNSTHETSDCHKLHGDFLTHYNEFFAYMRGRGEARGLQCLEAERKTRGVWLVAHQDRRRTTINKVRGGVRGTLLRYQDRRGDQQQGLDGSSNWGATLGGVATAAMGLNLPRAVGDTAVAPAAVPTPSWTRRPPEAGYGYGLAAHGGDHGGGLYGNAGGGYGFDLFPDGGGLFHQQHEQNHALHYPSAARPDAYQPRAQYEAFDTSTHQATFPQQQQQRQITLTGTMDSCRWCLPARGMRGPVPKQGGGYRGKGAPNDVFHIDIWGGYTATIGGNHYMLFGVDAATGWMVCYAMRRMSEALAVFKRMVVDAAHKAGTAIKCIRCDCDALWTSGSFKEFCAGMGIALEYSPPGMQEYNGVVESAIQRCLKVAKASRRVAQELLGPAGFSRIRGLSVRGDELWAESVKDAAQKLNQSASPSNPGGASRRSSTPARKALFA
ncbi:unnamed protein product [Ectocarpus sp. CCAP 1310/34]|nr:unnamed protein product [Ectocarpus sp. CCAP 1310/34]